MSCLYIQQKIYYKEHVGEQFFFLPHRKAMLKIDTLLVRRFTILFMCLVLSIAYRSSHSSHICPRIRATTITPTKKIQKS